MDLEKDGFLSPDIAEWIELNRRANPRWFNLAYSLNRMAQRHLLSLAAKDDDLQEMLVALLYARGLTNFQGSVLLAERGHIVGARTLARSCFEDVFYLGAVQSAPSYYERLLHADRIIRKRLANVLLRLQQPTAALNPTEAALLNDFLATLPSELNGQPDQISKVASDAGLADIYNTYYRGLSNDAAHPSVISLGRHMDDQSNRFVWGPEPDQVGETIEAACTAVFFLITGIRLQRDEDATQDPEFEALRGEHRALIKLMADALDNQRTC
jgi:hypothetical protein